MRSPQGEPERPTVPLPGIVDHATVGATLAVDTITLDDARCCSRALVVDRPGRHAVRAHRAERPRQAVEGALVSVPISVVRRQNSTLATVPSLSDAVVAQRHRRPTVAPVG